MKKLLLVLMVLALYPFVPAMAVKVDSLFQAELPVSSQSEELRADVMKRGLLQVLTKVSGDDQIDEGPAIKSALAHASDFVQEYSYTPSVIPSSPYLINIRYDEPAIRRLLKKSGLTYWGANRPLILVWLAVTDTKNQTQIISNETPGSILNALELQSKQYGLPLIIPVMDMTDIDLVSAENIIANELPLLKEVGKRYSPAAMLVGHVEMTAEGMQSQWKLVMGEHQWDFTASDKTVDRLVASALNQTSQALSKRFSDKTENTPAELWLPLEIGNITEKNDLAELVHYLKQISMVQQVQLAEVTGDVVNVSVLVRGTASAFQRDAEMGQRLVLQQQNEGENTLIYDWIH